MANNSLSYNAMLTILQDAAVGGMTATKFSTLQTLAAMLNQANGITVSTYVQQIADDVILGNSANATWNGGSSTATTLGNLSATSTQTQVNELIGKWFLGTDLPSLSVSAHRRAEPQSDLQDLDAAAVRDERDAELSRRQSGLSRRLLFRRRARRDGAARTRA